MIECINEIDDTTEEGKYLLMAIVKLTAESQADKTPDEVLKQITSLVNHTYCDGGGVN